LSRIQRFGVAMIKGVGNCLCLDRLHEARKDLRIFDQFGEFQWLLGVVNVAYNKATFIMEERGIGIEEASICTALKISVLASKH